MEDHEYKYLEQLLGKLANEMKAEKLMLFTPFLLDGYQIGGYNVKGELVHELCGPTIKDAVKKLKSVDY